MRKFETRLRVRVNDINYGGHLANDRVLTYFHEGRVRYLEQLGVSEGDIGDGVSLIQTEAYIAYKGEAYMGDLLNISIWIDDFRRTRFKTHYRIQNAEGKEIAAGYVVLAGFDYQARKPRRIPEAFKEKIRQFQDGSPIV